MPLGLRLSLRPCLNFPFVSERQQFLAVRRCSSGKACLLQNSNALLPQTAVDRFQKCCFAVQRIKIDHGLSYGFFIYEGSLGLYFLLDKIIDKLGAQTLRAITKLVFKFW